MGEKRHRNSRDEPQSLFYILLSALAFLFGWSLSKLRAPLNNRSESGHPQNNPTYASEIRNNPNATPVTVVIDSIPPPQPINEEQRAKAHDEERKERLKSGLEIVATFIALCLLVANWFQGCQTKHAADSAKIAATTASRQLEMADRPWLKESVTSDAPFLFQNGAISWAVLVRASNVGHSVATGVFVQTKLIALVGADYVDGPRQQLNEFCDKVANTAINPTKWGVSVFPNDSSDLPSSLIMWPKEVQANSIDGGADLGRSIFPMLIGCIDYQYPTSEHRHQTRFIYDVLYKTQPFISIGKTLPMEGIRLSRHSVSGQYAY